MNNDLIVTSPVKSDLPEIKKGDKDKHIVKSEEKKNSLSDFNSPSLYCMDFKLDEKNNKGLKIFELGHGFLSEYMILEDKIKNEKSIFSFLHSILRDKATMDWPIAVIAKQESLEIIFKKGQEILLQEQNIYLIPYDKIRSSKNPAKFFYLPVSKLEYVKQINIEISKIKLNRHIENLQIVLIETENLYDLTTVQLHTYLSAQSLALNYKIWNTHMPMYLACANKIAFSIMLDGEHSTLKPKTIICNYLPSDQLQTLKESTEDLQREANALHEKMLKIMRYYSILKESITATFLQAKGHLADEIKSVSYISKTLTGILAEIKENTPEIKYDTSFQQSAEKYIEGLISDSKELIAVKAPAETQRKGFLQIPANELWKVIKYLKTNVYVASDFFSEIKLKSLKTGSIEGYFIVQEFIAGTKLTYDEDEKSNLTLRNVFFNEKSLVTTKNNQLCENLLGYGFPEEGNPIGIPKESNTIVKLIDEQKCFGDLLNTSLLDFFRKVNKEFPNVLNYFIKLAFKGLIEITCYDFSQFMGHMEKDMSGNDLDYVLMLLLGKKLLTDRQYLTNEEFNVIYSRKTISQYMDNLENFLAYAPSGVDRSFLDLQLRVVIVLKIEQAAEAIQKMLDEYDLQVEDRLPRCRDLLTVWQEKLGCCTEYLKTYQELHKRYDQFHQLLAQQEAVPSADLLPQHQAVSTSFLG